MRSALVLSLTLLLLWALVAQLNTALAPLHAWVFAGGLLVAYGALLLPRAEGLAAALFAGAVCDANAPVPFGTHALLFAAADLLIFNARGRLPREETAGRLIVALVANFWLFLALSLACGRRAPSASAEWFRLGADLLWSELFVAAAGPWFFALQGRALELARARPGWR